MDLVNTHGVLSTYWIDGNPMIQCDLFHGVSDFVGCCGRRWIVISLAAQCVIGAVPRVISGDFRRQGIRQPADWQCARGGKAWCRDDPPQWG